MISFDGVSVRYDGASAQVLSGVTLDIPEGELCLVIGETGAGKSTLLRCINGLVPHFSGGTLTGRITVAGRDTRTHPPRELADVVGVVLQEVRAGFVTDAVEDELAYSMESLGIPPAQMRRRVEETLDLLGLSELRDRPLSTLSGGQAQRVAIGSVLTTHPKVLVLDEPTSALDPGAAEEVLAALQRMVHDLGLTVVLAEHRLERVIQYADRIIRLPGAGQPPISGAPAEVLRDSPVVPPVVTLGRLAGWNPPPLTVRDARRKAGPLRARLAGARPVRPVRVVGRALIEVRGLTVRHGAVRALDEVDFHCSAGEVVAVMGRNGAGKSTLLGALAGLHAPSSGRVDVDGIAPAARSGREVVRHVGLVPQDPSDLLYADSVGRECADADRDSALAPGTTASTLSTIVTGLDPHRHPRDLSEGQRLALAIAVVLAPAPPVLALDEPTRGLDYPSKARLIRVLRALADAGHALVLATHDVELAAEVADRVVVLADGEVVADGPTGSVVLGSPLFAPQVAKVLAPVELLTPDDVRVALGTTA